MSPSKPDIRPANPHFSSGPCTKRPGWDFAVLSEAVLGRSHRSAAGKARLNEVIERTRRVLDIPPDWRIGVVPASDTGAFEMAMWSLLGARGVDAFVWESFGKGWAGDIGDHLGVSDLRVFEAPYGEIPDLGAADPARDVAFVWNGTTSGVRVPDGDWISDDREGLTLCDATSAVFAMDMPWTKLDVTTWSWQKALGGEGAHGMIVLSPRAVERLETHVPPWPIPKIFRLTRRDALIEGVFRGETLNTPSMLCVEDAIDSLDWCERNGGTAGMRERAKANMAVLSRWVEETGWIDFLARDSATRSWTSVCLVCAHPDIASAPEETRRAFAKAMAGRLEREGAAYDIESHRDSPPGLRIWTGPTVEASDVEALLPWLDWAFGEELRSAGG